MTNPAPLPNIGLILGESEAPPEFSGSLQPFGEDLLPFEITVETVTLSVPTISLEIGTTGSATATVRDALGNGLAGRTVTWDSSSNPVIADPSNTTTGLDGSTTISYEALAAGTTTITATCEPVGSTGVGVTVFAVAEPRTYSAGGSASETRMRHQDWPLRLARFYRARRNVPFAWGANDCCTLAADWVVEATGVDPIADIRGWDDALSASRTLEVLGGMRAAVTARMGGPINWMLAQRGDVVMMTLDGRPTLGVVISEYAIAPGEEGALLVPLGNADCAWRVA